MDEVAAGSLPGIDVDAADDKVAGLLKSSNVQIVWRIDAEVNVFDAERTSLSAQKAKTQ